jgi:predicted nucleic acid-binding protein
LRKRFPSSLDERLNGKTNPPDLAKVLGQVRAVIAAGEMRFVAHHSERLFTSVIDTVAESEGRLNFNDALLVGLQREQIIGDVASFDSDFDSIADFSRFK